jgi:hypothetical protein
VTVAQLLRHTLAADAGGDQGALAQAALSPFSPSSALALAAAQQQSGGGAVTTAAAAPPPQAVVEWERAHPYTARLLQWARLPEFM